MYYCYDTLRNRMLNEMFHEMTPVALFEDDLNSMYYSIENRSPFLDTKLFEFVNTIPTQYLIQNGYGKAILRDAMKGLVPDFVLKERRKMGFNMSLNKIFDFKKNEKWIFNASPVWDYYKKEKIKALMDKNNFDGEENKFLWGFLNTKIFLEEFE